MSEDEAAPPAPESTEPVAPPAPPAAPPPVEQPAVWRPNYVFLAVVSTVLLLADVVTKWWATETLADAEGAERRVEVIKGHLRFIFARNHGGAFGLLQGEPAVVRVPFFILISVGAIFFIIHLYRRLAPNQTALKWGLPLVLSGAVGNLIDRIRYNYVVDFIDVKASWLKKLPFFHSEHWPTFNIADIAICVGVGLMAVDMFQSRKSTNAPKPVEAAAQPESRPASPEGS